MAITPTKIACVAAVGIGASLLLAACGTGGGREPQDGPFDDFATDLMARLKPGVRGANPRLSVTEDAVRQVRGDDGRPSGAYDGSRLLRAADQHEYGPPADLDAQADVLGDGFATFHEVREVAAHFDVDLSGAYDYAETRAFETAVGIRWLPA